MSETTTAQPIPPLTPLDVSRWAKLRDVPGVVPYEVATTLNRGSGEESIVILDVVDRVFKDGAGQRVGTEPYVEFQRQDGAMEGVPAALYLEWTGFDARNLDGMEAQMAAKEEEARKQEIAREAATLAMFRPLTPEEITARDERLDREAKERQEAYDKKLFSPIVRPESDLKNPGYSHLLSDDPTDKAVVDAYNEAMVPIREGQKNHDRYVTSGSREQAAKTVVEAARADAVLAEIIRGQEGKIDLKSPLAVVDAIRTDPDLRMQVGKHLRAKLEEMIKKHPLEFPTRVAINDNKAISGPLVEQLSHTGSRDYAVLLALAKIDGSFNDERARGDEIVRKPYSSNVELGQHRAAAELLLFGVPDAYPIEA